MASGARLIQRRVRQGISWNAISLLVNKGLTIVVKLLLARLLVPEYFGLISMIIVTLGLVKIFVDLGLQHALIQRKRDQFSLVIYDSAFWLLLGSGFVWMILFWGVGIPLMLFVYEEQQLVDLAFVMGFTIPVYSLSILPMVRLTRRMKFQKIVVADFIGVGCGAVVAIALAALNFGVWSLVFQQVVSVTVTTLAMWWYVPWYPRRQFSLSALKKLVSFSGYMLGSKVIYFVRTNMDNVFIGAILGASSLGTYTIAFALTETLRTNLSMIVSRVMLPAYAKLQSQPEAVRESYLSATRVITLLIFPVSLSLVLCAEPLINVLFSDSWSSAIAPTRILAVAGMVYAVSGPSAEVLQGIGRPKVLFRIAILNLLIVAIPSMWLLAHQYGLNGAAYAVLIAFITMRLMTHIALRRLISLRDSELWWAISPGILGTVLVSIIWALIGDHIHFSVMILITFLVFSIIFVVIQKNMSVARILRNTKDVK